MNKSSIVDVESRSQLESLPIEQIVRKNEQLGIYVGLEWKETCSCLCPNTFQFPVIIYPKGKSIEKEIVLSLNVPTKDEMLEGEKRICGVSEIKTIDPSNELYQPYMELLEKFSLNN